MSKFSKLDWASNQMLFDDEVYIESLQISENMRIYILMLINSLESL